MCIPAITLLAALALPIQLAAQHTRYRLIDIGTLGGPSAHGPGNGFPEASSSTMQEWLLARRRQLQLIPMHQIATIPTAHPK